MDLIIALVFLIIGLGGLSFGAEFLIRGAVSVSHLIGLSPFIIGLTVVAWGTSAPEVVVTVGAAVNGVQDVAVGNVIGSNITNVLLIGGTAALVLPLFSARGTISRSSIFLIAATLFVLFLSFGLEVLPRWAGLLMLGTMLVQTIAIFIGQETQAVEEATNPGWNWGLSSVALIGGLTALIVGGQIFIIGAVDLAEQVGLPEAVIGATIVAIGTSLPELFASLAAARHGHGDVVIGNIIGSNLTNILLVLGLVALISPLDVPTDLLPWGLVLFGLTSGVFIALLLAGQKIGRGLGLAFLALFVVYILHSLSGGLELFDVAF
ncbi:MAG: sodium:calcium antiporter [Pseudomonadota bacterium]|nr:sodium:calcium antiporter [Pseudomonadota bacterium]